MFACYEFISHHFSDSFTYVLWIYREYLLIYVVEFAIIICEYDKYIGVDLYLSNAITLEFNMAVQQPLWQAR